jgi:mRNA interferase RelE/StbE
LAWTIEFGPNARRELSKLDRPVQRRLVQYLEQRVVASGDPRQFGEAMRGDKGDLWKYRVGAYRIVCMIEDRRLVVLVVTVGHRREVYR